MSVPPETTPPESSRREPKRPKLVFFVDANVLLELYGALDPRVDEVAPKLLEVGESLFLPRQIADEVERGKLRVAQDASQRVLAGLKAPSPKLPVGLHQHGAALRSAVETLKTTIEEVQKSAADYVEAVAESRDGLSVALAPF